MNWRAAISWPTLAPPGTTPIVNLVQVERWTIGGAGTWVDCAGGAGGLDGGAADEPSPVGGATVGGRTVGGAETVAGTETTAEVAGRLTTGSSCGLLCEDEQPAASRAATTARDAFLNGRSAGR